METLVDLLASAASTYGERTAVSLRSGESVERWNFRRLSQASDAVAAHLLEEGVAPGDRVLVRAPSSPRLVATYFGCMRAGAILVPLDATSMDDFAERVAARAEAAAFIGPDGALPRIAGVRHLALESLPDAGPGHAPDVAPPTEESIAEIVFTSGTTGDPKGVVLTHGNIMANVGAIDGVIPRGRDYRLLSLLPLSHMLEQTAGLYLPLSYGASITYISALTPDAVLTALREERITSMVAVPGVLELLLRGIEREARRGGREASLRRAQRLARWLPMRLRRVLFRSVHRQLGGALEFVMCGGADLAPGLFQAWERLGVRVVEGYGATECSPVIAINTLNDRVPGSVGRPVRGLDVRISPEGELLVRGPSVTSGYWRDEEATRAAFTEDGWLRTGDLVEQGPDGRLSIHGRLRDLIVLPSGLNVHPEDVERELAKEEGVADCVVVGVPDPGGVTRVRAVALPEEPERPGEELDAELQAAMRRANTRLQQHQRMTAVTRWPDADFPRTGTMKVRRASVRDWLAAGAPDPPASETR